MIKLKTQFWYESNACWGVVKTVEELYEKYILQTDHEFGALKDVHEFLDKSTQNHDGSLDFGTRMEHSGKKTLRTFLKEIDILDVFIFYCIEND